MAGLSEGQLTKRIRNSFVGGVNYYLGPRQIKDNESPNATDCDFKGSGGIGNRAGYAQIGSVTSSRTAIYGMGEYHTAALDYAIKFASNGSNIQLGYSTGSSWTFDSSFSFTDATNINACQAGGKLYSGNGVDIMKQWDGSSWVSTTNGAIIKYPTYFDKRIWGVDPSNLDTLKFSGQYASSGSNLGDFTTGNHGGTVTIFPGSGAKITGLVNFKDNLYVFLSGPIKAIFKIAPASAADTFSVTMITNTIGCVSHRSIAQIENDLYFAADDGVYSLGEVAQFTSIRTTNKSLRIQQIFDSLSGTSKQKLVGKYFNFKYHLFYPLYGGQNDSCVPYDIRYQGWQDWRNIAAQDATKYSDSTGKDHLYFGEPSTGKIMELYSGTTNNGTVINSTFYTKSFDEAIPDVEKQYMDTTFVFGSLGGSVTVTVVFNDSETSATKTLTQSNPQGGFGRNKFGRTAFGKSLNTITVSSVVNQPQRLRAKGQKFAVQYRITSSSSWRLDAITQTFIPFGHYKFPSNNKLN